MNLLRNRQSNDDDVLKGKFIRKSLAATAHDIEKEVRKRTSGFRSGFWSNRNFTVSDQTLDYQHLKQHRFLDMRSRQRKDGTKTKKKSYAIHNRVVFGNYNQLIKELSFGFTEAIKNELRELNEE